MAQNDRHMKGARCGRGFARAGVLVQPQIRKAGEGRGFAVARLLTHWDEIVGQDTARLCRPVQVSYGQGGLGATLIVLARGAAGPMLQAQLPALRARVNACYGYNAIARIRITQTAAEGFADPQAPFAPQTQADRHGRQARASTDGHAAKAARTLTRDVADPTLRDALARLGAQVMSRASE